MPGVRPSALGLATFRVAQFGDDLHAAARAESVCTSLEHSTRLCSRANPARRLYADPHRTAHQQYILNGCDAPEKSR